jgi:hypothetical protein
VGLALTQPFGLGAGVQEPFLPPAPGANTNLTVTIDGQGMRRLSSLVFTLTTDANAANRYATVEYVTPAGRTYAVAAVTAVQAASLTNRYVGSLGYGVSSFNTGTDGFFPLPPVFLYPGDSLKILVASKQAGDTLTLIAGMMERFPLDGVGLPPPNPRV